MELDDVVEEGLGDGERRVRMTQGHEVGHLGEPIHHRENHGFASHLWKPLDKVHGDVAPH
jgi:hypothetical protein